MKKSLAFATVPLGCLSLTKSNARPSVAKRNLECLKILLEFEEIDVDSKDIKGVLTPLLLAIKAKNEYCNYPGKRLALDAGGGPVKWYTRWNNETKKYINHYMNGTEFQTGSCTTSDESDGALLRFEISTHLGNIVGTALGYNIYGRLVEAACP